MIYKTMEGWFSLYPYQYREIFDLPLDNRHEMIDEALDAKGKKLFELILRSTYKGDDFLDLRYYYLQNFAKTYAEKNLCLQTNMADLYFLSDQQEEDENSNEMEKKWLQLVMFLHICYVGEIAWSVPEHRQHAEEMWTIYQSNDGMIDMVQLRSVILHRYPLLAQPEKMDTEWLLKDPEEIALQTYAKALYYFAQDASSGKAQSLLEQSIQLNPLVPPLLFQKKRTPKKPPLEYDPGAKSEAEYIAYLAGESWWTVKDAIHWLKKFAH
jgi:hypothetical protein